MFLEFCNPPESRWETSCCGAATPPATARTSWLKSWADMIRGREMGASATLTSGCRLLRVFFGHILCQRGNNNKCWVQSGTSSREVSTPSGSVRTTSGKKASCPERTTTTTATTELHDWTAPGPPVVASEARTGISASFTPGTTHVSESARASSCMSSETRIGNSTISTLA